MRPEPVSYRTFRPAIGWAFKMKSGVGSLKLSRRCKASGSAGDHGRRCAGGPAFGQGRGEVVYMDVRQNVPSPERAEAVQVTQDKRALLRRGRQEDEFGTLNRRRLLVEGSEEASMRPATVETLGCGWWDAGRAACARCWGGVGGSVEPTFDRRSGRQTGHGHHE